MAGIDVVAAKIRENLRFDKGTSGAQLAPSPFINSVEYIAQLFEDSSITDTASGNEVQRRLGTMLGASANGGGKDSVLHFSGIFYNCSDGGFRPDFRDPWPGFSNNQVGHFMTAVDFGYRPSYVKIIVPNMSLPVSAVVPGDESFCIGLIVGHEQVPDDANFAFVRQALSASAEDIEKFYHGVLNVPRTTVLVDLNLRRSHANLMGIKIGTGRGNSIQDLLLSLYGYGFGRIIRNAGITTRNEAARWIRAYLGNP